MSKDGKQTSRRVKSGRRTRRRARPLVRDALKNAPLPRHPQPTINHEKMSASLAAAAKFSVALQHDRAELRKSLLKLDEIVRLLNSGTDPASIMNLIESTVQECRVIFAEGTKTLGDLKKVFAIDDDASGPER